MSTIHTGKAALKVEAIAEEGIEEVLHSGATDFLGDLEAKIATVTEKLRKSKHAAELVRLQGVYSEAVDRVRTECGYVKGAVALEESTITGLRFRAVLSKAANSTTVVEKEKLIKWIEENFSKAELMELVKFGIGDLRSYLPKSVFEQFTKTERTGNRKLVIKAFKPMGGLD